VFNQQKIKKFQIIQRAPDYLIILYCIFEDELDDNYKLQVESSIYKVMSSSVKIKVSREKTHDIPSLPNGKFLYVYRDFK
jgi:hypothetical protein